MSRRLRPHEVLQTSAMDCGPAALKSLLESFGVAVDYDDLRHAVHTSADGTSIDDLEDFCRDCGFEAFQEIVPIADAQSLFAKLAPAVVVVRGPAGSPHFVVLWRALWGWLDIMDPARGQRWVRASAFLEEVHTHVQRFDGAGFAEWFPQSTWFWLLEQRTRRFGFELPAASDATALASVDAAGRLATTIARSTRVRRSEASTLLTNVRAGARTNGAQPIQTVNEEVWVKGAVLLVVRSPPPGQVGAGARVDESPRPRSLVPETSSFFRGSARVAALFVATGTFLAAIETLVLRAMFQAHQLLGLPAQRATFIGLYAAIVLSSLLVEHGGQRIALKLGAAAELRFRMALLSKLPRLADSYFRTRPFADIVQRANGVSLLRSIPAGLASVLRTGVDLVITMVVLTWLYPRGLELVAMLAVTTFVIPLLLVGVRSASERRSHVHSSSLGLVQLDALLGLTPLRTHGGSRALRARQTEAMVDWRTETMRSVGIHTIADAIQSVGALVATFFFLRSVLRDVGEVSGILLIAFWALRLPSQARAFLGSVQRIPEWRAAYGRLAEPLAARTTQEPVPALEETVVMSNRRGLALAVNDVQVQIGGRDVLVGLSFDVAAGEHVAIVGSSGAGKSSIVGMLLGLLERRTGEVHVDGRPIDDYDVQRLRRECVWIDPTVQLWNRSFRENLWFGNPIGARNTLDDVLDAADLKSVLDRLDDGFETPLGESGARVSGGEGQRVRAARALLRRGARAIFLDEAFRGLERAERVRLSRLIRGRHRGVTVIEVTHDVAETLDFDRVLVLEGGRLVEDGRPRALHARAGSRYRQLVDADARVGHALWADPTWSHARVEDGRLIRGKET